LPYEKIGNEVRCIADEVPFDIPDGWEWARLKNLVYNNGQIKPKTDFCYIDIGSIDNLNQKLNDLEKIVSADKAPSRARKIVKLGDILYSTVRPYLHNMCIIDRNFSHIPIASTGFAVLTTFRNFFNKFLFYYLLSPDFDSYANNVENSKGVAYPAINDERLYKSLIPIPPFEEQKKIVAKIEEILPYIRKYDKTEKQLTALNTNFPEQLKKSILQQAVQGKLVPQSKDDEPASVLLEKIRTEKQQLVKEGKIKKDKNESIIFKRDKSHYERIGNTERCIDDEIPFEIPDNWAWTRLKNIVYNGGQQKPNTDFCYIDIGSIDNIKNKLNTEEKIISADKAPSRARKIVSYGDILYSTVRPYLHNMCIVDRTFTCKPIASTGFAVFTTFKNLFNKYLFYYLLSPDFDKYANNTENSKGVAYPAINDEKLYKAFITIPPENEQKSIVIKIEEILAVIERL
jgi:type I restriction enzyme S subunit